MKRMVLTIGVLLSGCSGVQAQGYQPQPSVTQVQNFCMKEHKKFTEQASCIENTLSSYSELNPYAQEYMAHLASLSEMVKLGKTSGNQARVELTKQLNRLRGQQEQEFSQQEATDSARAQQTYEMLKQEYKPLEPYRAQNLPTHTNTNCYKNGNQISCRTY